MSVSFQEKSLWVQLVGVAAAFSGYFALVLPTGSPVVLPRQIVLFVVAVALLAIVQVVAHVVLAIVDRRTGTDERDRSIELRGARAASYVLASGVFFALCAAVVVPGNFLFTHLLLGFWVLAQLVEFGVQLALYRRGG
jgi:hypothetical protein